MARNKTPKVDNMAQFGNRSIQNLNTCDSDLIKIFTHVVGYFDCAVICGHRNQEEQDDLYHRGLTKLKFPFSKHNTSPSMAADVAPYPIDWNDIRRFDLFAGRVITTAEFLYEADEISHLIRWGGDWDGDTQVKDQTFNDLPHFELIKVE